MKVLCLWMTVSFALSVVPNSSAPPSFEHLVVDGNTTRVRNETRLQVSVGPGFRLSGPHHFTKSEDNGYHFEVSLLSYVAPDAVVSVAAERLLEDSALNYDDLQRGRWPDASFLLRASGCATLTPEQAAGMPAESGMQWILATGFVPNGSFAFEAALLVADDRRHEASIELIAPVSSCDDSKAIDAALDTLRGRVTVTRAAQKAARAR
jgi:hypothetical protein